MLFWIMLLFKSCGKPTMQVCMGFCNIELQWSYIQCNWLTGYAYFYCEALHCPAFDLWLLNLSSQLHALEWFFICNFRIILSRKDKEKPTPKILLQLGLYL
jgi:hypothetical protein